MIFLFISDNAFLGGWKVSECYGKRLKVKSPGWDPLECEQDLKSAKREFWNLAFFPRQTPLVSSVNKSRFCESIKALMHFE